MLDTMPSWQMLEVSSDQTHHLIDKEPAYMTRFLFVLKFHEPGLAAVKDLTGAFHINALGEPAYSNRFLQTFGFYEARAAVQDISGWYHILSNGSELYSSRWAWCGNYQQGHCTVKDLTGNFFHIDLHGQKSYAQNFCYAGDFHDGYAVVQNNKGFHTHIDFKGSLLHGKWFTDLDVYHKGFARAKDNLGWFHIDCLGLPIYEERYKNVEPFYNGIARVETTLGGIYRITEKGDVLEVLRRELEDEFHQASAELVSYWRFYTLQAGNEFQVFDHLPNKVSHLSKLIKLEESMALRLLRGLEEMGFVKVKDDEWECTNKGAFFKSEHPYSLKNAARLWKEEHLVCWSHLSDSLKRGVSAFQQLFGKKWFDFLKNNPEKNELYHSALAIYARQDYAAFSSSIDFDKHRSLMDVGGSTGALLIDILNKNSHLEGVLLDLPNVIQLVKIPAHLQERIRCISSDFFRDFPVLQVESVVLSRILHDWADEEAIKILEKIHSSLSDNPDNRLYILEKIQDEENANGSLLDLNMLVMTGGVERTLKDFKLLLAKTGFVLEEIKPLNQVSSILIVKRINSSFI